MKSDAIMLVAVQITVFWDFMPCGLEEVQFSRTSSGQERILPKPDKVVQFPGWKPCPSKGRQ